MNMNRIVLTLSVLIVFISTGSAQSIDFNGKISNSVYSYEDTTAHTRLYQFFRLSLKSHHFSNLTLNSSFRALTDINETLDNEQRFKAFTLNLKLQKLFNCLDVTLGRQFLHPGTILGGLDGLYAQYYFSKRMNFSAYAGVETHFQRSLKVFKTDDSFVTGGLFELKKIFSSSLQTFYLQKSNKDDIFWQLTGLNFQNSLIPRTNLKIQAHYDLKNSRIHRLLVSTRSKVTNRLSFSLGLKNQYPQIYASSFFQIFEIEAYRQYKFGCSYNIMNNYYLQGQYQLVKFDTENANRFFVTVSNTNGSMGLIYESGYAGEQLGVIMDYAYSITPALIASLSIDYSRYKTEKVYEFDSQIANAARLSYRFQQHWSIDVEYQWLTNRFKENDSRILNHIHFSW